MYRAVIFGEEHIVKGWNGENLLTDKGEFVFRRLKGKQVDSEWAGEIPGGVPSNHPIQSTTLLEVATLQSDENGGWLLNGHNFLPLQFLPAGCRLNGITSSEVLRVHKGKIHAVAWVQAISAGNITLQLDTVLADWKTARKFDQANVKSAIAEWSGLVTTAHPVGQRKLLGRPFGKLVGCHLLRGLWSGSINHAHDPNRIRVNVQTEFDATIMFADDGRPVSLGVVLLIGSFHGIYALRDNRADRNSIMSSRGKIPEAGRRVQCGAQPDEASNTLTRRPATHHHASDSRARPR